MFARLLGTPLFSLSLSLGLALSLSACDGDGGDSGDSGDGSGADASGDAGDAGDGDGGDGDAGGAEACEASVAANACDPDCGFEPADIDCANACQNIADQCASDACSASDSCVGQNQDVALCTVACEGSKTLSCSNVVFGCWDTAGGNNCEDVGTCVGMY